MRGGGESKVGIGLYRIVKKMMCCLERGYDLFQRCVKLDEQKQRAGLV